MAGITLEMATARLTAYLAAEEKILAGQTVQLGGRTLGRAALADVQAGIALWQGRVIRLERAASGGAGLSVAEVIPL